MFKIVRKQKLNAAVVRMDIEAGIILEKWKPGQHVVLMADPYAKRLAFNTVDIDEGRGVLSVAFREDDPAASRLSSMKIGQEVYAMLGPLGKPLDIPNKKTILCLAQDMQAAAIVPICRAAKAAQNKVLTVVNFATRKEALLESALRVNSQTLTVTSREQSFYKTATWQEVLSKLLNKHAVDMIYADGSLLFLQDVVAKAKQAKVHVEINALAALMAGVNVFDQTSVPIGRKDVYVNVDGLILEGDKINTRALLKHKETHQEYERCQIKSCASITRPNGLSILTKLFKG